MNFESKEEKTFRKFIVDFLKSLRNGGREVMLENPNGARLRLTGEAGWANHLCWEYTILFNNCQICGGSDVYELPVIYPDYRSITELLWRWTHFKEFLNEMAELGFEPKKSGCWHLKLWSDGSFEIFLKADFFHVGLFQKRVSPSPQDFEGTQYVQKAVELDDSWYPQDAYHTGDVKKSVLKIMKKEETREKVFLKDSFYSFPEWLRMELVEVA